MGDMDPGLRREDNKGRNGVNLLNQSEHQVGRNSRSLGEFKLVQNAQRLRRASHFVRA
jgi:hypothetical protein